MSDFKAMEIMGYADRFSVAAGETIKFMISTRLEGSYAADLVRVVCGDRRPGGAGFEEHRIESPFAGHYPARYQAINHGSYGIAEPVGDADAANGFTLEAAIFPTTPGRPRQGLIGTWRRHHDGSATGASLVLEGGHLALLYATADGTGHVARSDIEVQGFRWQSVAVKWDPASGQLTFRCSSIAAPRTFDRSDGPIVQSLSPSHAPAGGDAFVFAGLADDTAAAAGWAGPWIVGHYNGKIDTPRWLDHAGQALGAWDFSRDITGQKITDTGPSALHGRTVNLPARGMTGANWDGTEHDWRHAPAQYGAIHFHDDDVHDCRWQSDFSFTVPSDLRSGVYAVRLVMDDHEYRIPFFVRAARDAKRNDIVFIAPTATYLAYANSRQAAELIHGATGDDSFLDEVYRTLRAHPELGLSGYDIHADGTPRRYMSRLRPLIDVQPGVNKAWSFQADTLILAWLERSGYAFDVITDDDLHREGPGALDGYRLAITGGHPEYVSTPMLDALERHVETGGRLIYMGGNGFYMRVAFSDAVPGAMEMRRVAQSLAGLWNEAPGQHHFSFTGELAGLWENLGRPLQALAGVGFADLMIGMDLTYEPTEAARSERAAFILRGVDGPVANAYGKTYGMLCSDEFDRFDPALGSPEHGLVVARAVRKAAVRSFEKDVAADMTFFETPSGGAVLSTASISWSLGLNHAGRDNAISRITRNVVDRFIDPAPFTMP